MMNEIQRRRLLGDSGALRTIEKEATQDSFIQTSLLNLVGLSDGRMFWRIVDTNRHCQLMEILRWKFSHRNSDHRAIIIAIIVLLWKNVFSN